MCAMLVFSSAFVIIGNVTGKEMGNDASPLVPVGDDAIINAVGKCRGHG